MRDPDEGYIDYDPDEMLEPGHPLTNPYESERFDPYSDEYEEELDE